MIIPRGMKIEEEDHSFDRDHPYRHIEEFWKVPQFDDSSCRATYNHCVVHVEGTEMKTGGSGKIIDYGATFMFLLVLFKDTKGTIDTG